MQARYQYGNLIDTSAGKRAGRLKFRWTENGKPPKSVLISEPLRSKFNKRMRRGRWNIFRIKINAPNPQEQFHTVTVGALIDQPHARSHAPKRCRENTQYELSNVYSRITSGLGGVGNSFSTSKRWLVEDWLESYPGSRQVKSHVRNLMHTTFQAALRWEMVERNY